jgi:hypothetical protein
MNEDELKALITTLIWTDLNASERVLSRWDARGPGFESPYLHLNIL